jgi:hypothetical protein
MFLEAQHADNQEKKRIVVSVSRSFVPLPLAPWLAVRTPLLAA